MFRIVLVDDEREEREGIAYLIGKYGYPLQITYAGNGKEALNYIYHHEVDILFTDVKMPVMDGLELAKLVYEYDPEIKIIIFSAYGRFRIRTVGQDKHTVRKNEIGLVFKGTRKRTVFPAEKKAVKKLTSLPASYQKIGAGGFCSGNGTRFRNVFRLIVCTVGTARKKYC